MKEHPMDEKTRDDRQKVRSMEQVAKRTEAIFLEREKPPKTPQFQRITDEEFLSLRSNPEHAKREFFTPASLYAAKIAKIRPLYQGEVGIVEKPGKDAVFLVLEDGLDQTPDAMVQVAVMVGQQAYLSDTPNGGRHVLWALSEEEAQAEAPSVVTRMKQFDACRRHELSMIPKYVKGENGTVAIFVLKCGTCGAEETVTLAAGEELSDGA